MRAAVLVLGMISMAGCATVRAPETVQTTVERVVFDDLSIGHRFTLVGTAAPITIGWRVEVALRGPDGKLRRAVEWIYDTGEHPADQDDRPPPEVALCVARQSAAVVSTPAPRWARARR